MADWRAGVHDRAGRPGTPVPVPPARRHGLVTCLVWVLAGALGLVVVLLVLVAWAFHRNTEPPPAPDVGRAAHSPAARRADRWAAATADARIARLGKRLPWLTPAGTSVTDRCTVEADSGAIGAKPQWDRARCLREVIAYFSFDGAAGQRTRELRSALAGLGWLTPLPGAAAGDTPTPGPTAPPVSFGLWGGSHPAGPGGDVRIGGEAAVAERPGPLRLSVSSADPRGDIPSAPPRDGPLSRSATLVWRPLSPPAAARAAYRSHRFVLAVVFAADYGQAAFRPTPPTLAGTPAPYSSPCYSGTHCG
jgi:hypothetical protein